MSLYLFVLVKSDTSYLYFRTPYLSLQKHSDKPGMRRKLKKEESEDSVITEIKELYKSKIKEQEALRNLLNAIEKNIPSKSEHHIDDLQKKSITEKQTLNK